MLAALNRARFFRLLRSISEMGSSLLIVYLLLTAWIVEPFQVVGSSMAPSLRGDHADFICPSCQTPYTIGLDEPASDFQAAVCPCCGDRSPRLDQAPIASGERLVVFRSSWLARSPRRGEVVALRQPQAQKLALKRIVALPGETIEIRAGDVFVDGRRWCKTLTEQRATGILVADSSHSPPSEIPSAVHWMDSPEMADKSRTLRVEGQRLADRVQFQSGPLSDSLPYNQNRAVRGSANAVDLRLVMQLSIPIQAERRIILRRDDARPFTFLFQSRSVALVDPKGLTVAATDWTPPSRSECEWTLSVVDAQYLLAVDGQVVLSWADEHEPNNPSTQRPFVLVGSQEGWPLRCWQLFRDVVYSDWPGAWPAWGCEKPCHLGPDEYFLLGDNSRTSFDSRDRGFGPVPEDQLLGRAIAVVWPVQARHWLGTTFQVLAPSRIRYIR